MGHMRKIRVGEWVVLTKASSCCESWRGSSLNDMGRQCIARLTARVFMIRIRVSNKDIVRIRVMIMFGSI